MWIKAVLILFVFMPGIASAADVALVKGRFVRDGEYATQALSLHNNTSATLDVVIVECGFFRGNEFLVSADGSTNNVGAGQTAYFEAVADHAELADRTDCRIMNAK